MRFPGWFPMMGSIQHANFPPQISQILHVWQKMRRLPGKSLTWKVPRIGGGLVFLASVFPAYHFLTKPYSAKTWIAHVTVSLLGLLVNVGQNLVVVSSAPTTWPQIMLTLVSTTSILTLNLEPFGLGCVIPTGAVSHYFCHVLVFPAVIGTLAQLLDQWHPVAVAF